jgi:hypothetical protein
MRPAAIQDLAFALPSDNGLLVSSVIAGEVPEHSEVVNLVAAVQAIYITATLESRELGRVDACHQLWTEVAKLFDELSQAWAQIDSDEGQIVWLRARLIHFASLARDRTELYDISEVERAQFWERKKDAPEETACHAR